MSLCRVFKAQWVQFINPSQKRSLLDSGHNAGKVVRRNVVFSADSSTPSLPIVGPAPRVLFSSEKRNSLLIKNHTGTTSEVGSK